jgi:hydroxymethylpyrimidine/phosphomethylpyrimidine kinase
VRPTVLTIAGSDCSGGAGIQADLKTIEAAGGYAATVLTAVTVQNTRGVLRVYGLPADLVRDQLEALLGDLRVGAVKSGMLGNEAVVIEVARALRRHRPPHYVCDPVMVSESGCRLLEAAATERLVGDLFPLASVVTPNVGEAAALTGLKIESIADAERAAGCLRERGARAVLITGGHLPGAAAVDLLVDEGGCVRIPGDRVDGRHGHGSGCTHASALATGLARGLSLVNAATEAKRFVTEAIRHGLAIGGGRGPTDPFFSLHGGPSWPAAAGTRRMGR